MWPLGDDGEVSVGGRPLSSWREELGQDFPVRHPWDLLDVNAALLELLSERFSQDPRLQYSSSGLTIIGEGSEILPGVYVEGKVLIGRNCKVGPNCYLRGSTSIGDGCRVGQAVEIKNSLIGNQTNVGHLSYVGDSVLSDGVNFGAGTITANFRHDGKDQRSMIGARAVSTGRRKLGAIVGKGVHTGVHTGFYPGRKMGPNTSTLPGEMVSRDKREA